MESLNPAEEPADLAALLPATRAYFAAAMPDMPQVGEARLRLWTGQGHRAEGFTRGVFEDRAEPALALLHLNLERDENLDLADAFLAAPPELLHGEAGRFALRAGLHLAAEHGRTRLTIGSPSTADVSGLAAALGGRKVNTTTRSVLDLAAVDRARYAARAEASAKNEGYRLVRWVDHCPEEFAESFCTAMDAMQDAPMEDLDYTHPKTDLDRLRGEEAHTVRYGVRRWVLAAVDAAGTVAGHHIIVTMPDEPETVDIWDTAVVREHRGRGLGLRIKAAATLWLLDELPKARVVQTFNNHGNTHMLAVNRALGYRKAEDWYGFEFATGA